ncbi:MAG TPA: hypothetical protein VJB59_10340 [Bdellovibrionota bacterium]|nr:hypothetical protein [Bdellovibrionota bacterium]
MARGNKGRARRAADVFKTCPRCESPNIIKVDDDVICAYCDWCSVDLDAPISSAPMRVSIPKNEDNEPARPGSLAAFVEKILEENPFLSGDPVFA